MNNSISNKSVKIIVGFISILVILFASATSFTFGHGVVGAFMLADIFGNELSSLLSGVLTLLLFDLGWLSGLLAFIYTAESIMQRAMSIVQFVVCFILSLIASVVSVVLLSPLSSSFGDATIETAKYIGIGCVIFALGLNAMSFAVQVLSNPETAKSIRVATNNARQQQITIDAQNALDNATITKANEIMQLAVPQLAQLRANAMTTQFVQSLGYDASQLSLNGVQPLTVQPPVAIDTPDGKPQIGFDALTGDTVKK